jgi:hypothetical protein
VARLEGSSRTFASGLCLFDLQRRSNIGLGSAGDPAKLAQAFNLMFQRAISGIDVRLSGRRQFGDHLVDVTAQFTISFSLPSAVPNPSNIADPLAR